MANKILSSLAMVVLLASCAEKQLPDSEVIPDFQSDAVVPTEIVASFAVTKVSYAETLENKLKPAWKADDKVIGFDENNNNYEFTVASVAADGSATLTGEAPANCTMHLIYLCGADKDDITSGSLSVNYEGQAGDETIPAVMLSDGEIQGGTGIFTFRNAGGIVGISAVNGLPQGTTVTKITVSGENLSAATIALNSSSALALTATPKTDDAISISVEDLDLTVTDENGTLSRPVLIAVPAGAVIAKVSASFPKEAETMKIPNATPQEGVDYVTIAGIKWAIWNVGVSESSEHPETDYGWYFYWGGTEGYYRYADSWQSENSTSFEFVYFPSSAYTVVANDYVYVKTQSFAITGHSFTWSNTPYHIGGDSATGWTKYIPEGFPTYWGGVGSPDNKLTLVPEDDAAHVNWGGNWRMPNTEEITALKNNTTSEWKENYNGTGINGRLFTSTAPGEDGHFIFIPAAGYGGSGSGSTLDYKTERGNYWTRNVKSDSPSNAFGLFTSSDKVSVDGTGRYHGFPVRPVLE